MAIAGVPADVALTCPRCRFRRFMVNVDGGTLFRCQGCEWYFTLSTQAPTGTGTAAVTAGSTVAITVASGGTSFTSGMLLLYDTAVSANAEVVTVTATGSATSIPVAGGFIKSHSSSAAFGQLSIGSTLSGVGEDQVPNLPGWGF